MSEAGAPLRTPVYSFDGEQYQENLLEEVRRGVGVGELDLSQQTLTVYRGFKRHARAGFFLPSVHVIADLMREKVATIMGEDLAEGFLDLNAFDPDPDSRERRLIHLRRKLENVINQFATRAGLQPTFFVVVDIAPITVRATVISPAGDVLNVEEVF